MEATQRGSGNLAVRWTAGVAAIISVRLLLEHRLPGGAALGLGMAVFMLLWIPTVPSEAYRQGSPLRRVLYVRLALFLVAVIVAAAAYETLFRVVG